MAAAAKIRRQAPGAAGATKIKKKALNFGPSKALNFGPSKAFVQGVKMWAVYGVKILKM